MPSMPSMPLPVRLGCFHDPGGYFVCCLAASCDEGFAAGVVGGPEREAAVAEEVFVVEAEFFQAGAGDLGEFEFCFFGCGAGRATFGDVLDAAAGGLDHLVMGAAAWVDVAVAEADGDVVDELGELEGFEVSVATVWWEEGIIGHEGEWIRG